MVGGRKIARKTLKKNVILGHEKIERPMQQQKIQKDSVDGGISHTTSGAGINGSCMGKGPQGSSLPYKPQTYQITDAENEPCTLAPPSTSLITLASNNIHPSKLQQRLDKIVDQKKYHVKCKDFTKSYYY